MATIAFNRGSGALKKTFITACDTFHAYRSSIAIIVRYIEHGDWDRGLWIVALFDCCSAHAAQKFVFKLLKDVLSDFTD